MTTYKTQAPIKQLNSPLSYTFNDMKNRDVQQLASPSRFNPLPATGVKQQVSFSNEGKGPINLGPNQQTPSAVNRVQINPGNPQSVQPKPNMLTSPNKLSFYTQNGRSGTNTSEFQAPQYISGPQPRAQEGIQSNNRSNTQSGSQNQFNEFPKEGVAQIAKPSHSNFPKTSLDPTRNINSNLQNPSGSNLQFNKQSPDSQLRFQNGANDVQRTMPNNLGGNQRMLSPRPDSFLSMRQSTTPQPSMTNSSTQNQPVQFNQDQSHLLETPSRRQKKLNPLKMKFQQNIEKGYSPPPTKHSEHDLHHLQDDEEEIPYRLSTTSSNTTVDFGKKSDLRWKKEVRNDSKKSEILMRQTTPLFAPPNHRLAYPIKPRLRRESSYVEPQMYMDNDSKKDVIYIKGKDEGKPKKLKTQSGGKSVKFNQDVEVYNVESFKMYNVDMGKRSRSRPRDENGADCSLI